MSKLTDFLGGFGGGGGIGGMPVQIVNSNTTVDPNFSIGIDTSQGSVEVTLPAGPLPGDRIFFFDAALTWNESPAIIHVNGNRVEQDNLELTSYSLFTTGGVQELLFVGDSVGWKDVTLYTTNVKPAWYGSYLAEEYPIIEAVSLEDVYKENVLSVTASGEHVVEDSGYYCIVMTGGSGGGGRIVNTTATYGRSGGDSRLLIDEVFRFRTIGGLGGIEDRANPPGELRCVIAGFMEIVSLGAVGAFASSLEEETTLWNYNPSRLLGIPEVINTGGGGGGYDAHPSSIITHLNTGSILRFEIGARGSAGSTRSPGKAGSAEVYFLGEAPWYTQS